MQERYSRYYQCNSCQRFTDADYIDFMGWKCKHCWYSVEEVGVVFDTYTKLGVCATPTCNRSIDVLKGTSRYCGNCQSSHLTSSNSLFGSVGMSAVSSAGISSATFFSSGVSQPSKFSGSTNSAFGASPAVAPASASFSGSNHPSSVSPFASPSPLIPKTPAQPRAFSASTSSFSFFSASSSVVATGVNAFKDSTLNNADGVLAIGMYYSKKSPNPSGAQDDFTQFVFDLKANKQATVAHLTNFIASLLANPVAVAVVPSSDPNKIAQHGITQVAVKLARRGGNIDAIKCIKRAQAIGKLALQGSDRSESVHENSLQIVNPDVFRGRVVLLLDDVATTGNSLIVCKRLLLASGASAVVCLVLAKTYTHGYRKPHYNTHLLGLYNLFAQPPSPAIPTVSAMAQTTATVSGISVAPVSLPLFVKAVLFDMDQTLIDTSALAPYRQFGGWAEIPKHIHECKVYSGVEDLLIYLSGQGFKLAVVSNSPAELCETLLKQYGLYKYFNSIVGYQHGKAKPNPTPVLIALNQVGINAQDAVMIGDSVNDIKAGSGAGCSTIAALWGIADPRQLLSSSPTRTASSVGDIRLLLKLTVSATSAVSMGAPVSFPPASPSLHMVQAQSTGLLMGSSSAMQQPQPSSHSAAGSGPSFNQSLSGGFSTPAPLPSHQYKPMMQAQTQAQSKGLLMGSSSSAQQSQPPTHSVARHLPASGSGLSFNQRPPSSCFSMPTPAPRPRYRSGDPCPKCQVGKIRSIDYPGYTYGCSNYWDTKCSWKV